MKRLFLSLMLLTCITGYAQRPADFKQAISSPSSSKAPVKPNGDPIPNPFTAPEQTAARRQGDMGMGMGMGGGADMGMEMMMGAMDEMAMDSYGGMMGMGAGPVSPESQFRRGLQRAIAALGKAEGEQEREVLRQYVRQALEKRYLEMIASRQRELDKLKQSVAKLEGDLKRRESAKDRVIEVQMQSVQLAAEGLMQLGDLGGDGRDEAISNYGGGYDGEYEMK